ncbi:helix-turn-helix transcriptional regulator [Nocardia otitidiscaviarum]|uniref:Helix-turn-helix transcriptional regulator n=1 Tax=Nocardia otitidiscaviarum TaxID=1823 RepID=A0A516NWE2_9NOCA|nr:helix-turn-helix transcriptional regulator [Nocardia otitidiscaviarum]
MPLGLQPRGVFGHRATDLVGDTRQLAGLLDLHEQPLLDPVAAHSTWKIKVCAWNFQVTRYSGLVPRRSYDHYCAVSRALDIVGDRWSLLVVRELCSGPRRYSDLFADLPGISTDMLAARLKDLEREGILTRGRAGTRAATVVYELTPAGLALRPVLDALSAWGTPLLGERRATDAVRAHWFALPLGRAVAQLVPEGTVTVRIGDTVLHYTVTDSGIAHVDGPAVDPDLELHLDLPAAIAVATGARSLTEAARTPAPER